MSDALQQIKARLSSRYLGIAGIHAIGVRAGALTVYYSGPPAGDRDQAFQRLREDAAPAAVQFIEEEVPQAGP